MSRVADEPIQGIRQVYSHRNGIGDQNAVVGRISLDF